MTEDGFGRCDGHHKMVDSKLKSAAVSGEADGLNVVADTAQQQLLTTPLQG